MPELKIRHSFKHLLLTHWSKFKIILQDCPPLPPISLSTKIAQMGPIHRTKWPPELKIRNIFKQRPLLLNHWFEFKVISQLMFPIRHSTIIMFNFTKQMSQCMRFPTMWYVRPAKPQISLRICAVCSEPLLVA